MSKRTCGICQKELPPQSRGRLRKYCKGECARQAKNNSTRERDILLVRQIRQCLNCWSTWCNIGDAGRAGPLNYCSDQCRRRYVERTLYKAPPKDCMDCGMEIVTVGNRTSRVRCRPCQDRVYRLKNNTHIPESTRRAVYERDGWVCQLCGEDIDRTASYPHPRCATPDHIIPWSQGGPNEQWNLQAAHWECNRAKGVKSLGSQLLLPLPT